MLLTTIYTFWQSKIIVGRHQDCFRNGDSDKFGQWLRDGDGRWFVKDKL